eukprot:329107-Chlamydomonas_euryale.AAC.12
MRTLSELGVLYWKLNADKYEHDERLEAICKARNYSHKVCETTHTVSAPDHGRGRGFVMEATAGKKEARVGWAGNNIM